MTEIKGRTHGRTDYKTDRWSVPFDMPTFMGIKIT